VLRSNAGCLTLVLVDAEHSDRTWIDAFLGVGIWLLFIALLIPAGVDGLGD